MNKPNLSFSAGTKQQKLSMGNKLSVYLSENHKLNQAITLKEECDSIWNLAWICRSHGQLDFKQAGARGLTRYLIGEILNAGGSVLQHPQFTPSINGATCHHGGVGYQGGIPFGSVANAVKYLKQYFNVVACPGNKTETQQWIDQQ